MKKILGIFLTISILITASVSAGAFEYGSEGAEQASKSFNDIPEDHWAKGNIDRAVAKGWFSGYPDNTFHPASSITRAEAMTVFVKFLGLQLKNVETSSYADVKLTDWYSPYIEAGKKLFPVKATYNGETPFRPEMPVTREDTIYALVIALKYNDKVAYADQSILNMFKDKNSISELVKPYAAVAVEYGLMSGYPDGTIGAQDPLTRAEFATLLARGSTVGFGTGGGIDDVADIVVNNSASTGNTAVTDTGANTGNAAVTDPGASAGNTTVTNPGTSAGNVADTGANTVAEQSASAGTDVVEIGITDFSATTHESQSVIKGKVTSTLNSNIVLTVNGEEISTVNGNFSKTVTLNVGDNNFTFVAAASSGVTTQKTVKVTRSITESNFDLTNIIPATTQESAVIIKGRVTNLAKDVIVLVNGSRTNVDSYGIFENAVTLQMGDNQIVIRLYNGDALRVEKIVNVKRTEPLVRMPLVVGSDIETAKNLLNDLNFQVEIINRFDNNVESGYVIEQSIVAGSDVALGSYVTITVSKGTNSWSEWVTSLPSNVDETTHIIEEKTQYRKRVKECTQSSMSSLDGWTLVGSSWEWSEEQGPYSIQYTPFPIPLDSNHYVRYWQLWNPHEPDVYSFKEKIYTYNYERWGDWSEWQDVAMGQEDNTQIETRIMYKFKLK